MLVGRGRCFAARADGAAEATGELLGRISHAKEARELQPELPRAAQHLGWCGWCGCGWCGLGWVRWSEGVGVEGCEAEVRYRLVRQYVVEAAVELAQLRGEETLLVGQDARLRLKRSARQRAAWRSAQRCAPSRELAVGMAGRLRAPLVDCDKRRPGGGRRGVGLHARAGGARQLAREGDDAQVDARLLGKLGEQRHVGVRGRLALLPNG